MAINCRKDFPCLGKKIYFDSSCMSLRPRQVIDAMNGYYEKNPACAGRSSHSWCREVTKQTEDARKTIAGFVGAKQDQIVFTKNTTESLNLLAYSLVRKGDLVLTSDREHNSNLVPWLFARERGVKHMAVPSSKDETFDLEKFAEMVKGSRLVSVVHTSNLDGYTLPIKEIIKIAHEANVLVAVDAAQAVPHHKINVRKLGADFLAFSGHKMLGPPLGVLYGKELERLSPFILGGDTVKKTTYDSYELMDGARRLEAGLQNYPGIIGLAAACRYLGKIGMDKIEKHELELGKQMRTGLEQLGMKVLGPTVTGINSFIPKIDVGDAGLMLNEMGVMVRTGQHCCHSWFNSRKLKGSVRASLYLYNTKEEVNIFLEKMKMIAKM